MVVPEKVAYVSIEHDATLCKCLRFHLPGKMPGKSMSVRDIQAGEKLRKLTIDEHCLGLSASITARPGVELCESESILRVHQRPLFQPGNHMPRDRAEHTVLVTPVVGHDTS